MRTARRRLRLLCVICGCLLIGQHADAQDKGLAEFPKLLLKTDWPWWRGPMRNGIAADQVVPAKLSDSENLVWKVPVPHRGHSSPVVVGNKIFLTTADEAQQVHYVLAFDRATGKSLWKVEASRGGFPKRNHRNNTEATPTIASDGERLIATFFHHKKVEAIALDFTGKILWRMDAGDFNPQTFEYGYGPSPVIYRQTVIVAGEYDGTSFLTGLDRANGMRLWRTERPPIISFSTPSIGLAGGKEQMWLSGSNKVSAYDPASGKSLWSVDGTSLATCGTAVWDGDILFASGGFPVSQTVAVKADGSGQVLWKNRHKCYEQSMLAWQGHVYALTDAGVLFCWRGIDGKEMWSQRLQAPVSASPVLANGNIYWAVESGKMFVFRANPERYESVAENQIGNEAFPSPAVCGGQIFLRVAQREDNTRQEFLYCFGSPTK